MDFSGGSSSASGLASQPMLSTIFPASVSRKLAAANSSLNRVEPQRQTMVGRMTPGLLGLIGGLSDRQREAVGADLAGWRDRPLIGHEVAVDLTPGAPGAAVPITDV